MALDSKYYTLNIKTENNNYVPLYPKTLQEQIIGWKGNFYGAYNLTLQSSSWQSNSQTLNLSDVLETDNIYVSNVLTGTISNMQQQDAAYKLLTNYELSNGQITFNCSSVPTIDINLQIFWIR